MVLPLFSFADVPSEYITFKGLLASAAEVMLLLSSVFPSFPVVPEVVLKKITPPEASVVEPLIVQFLIVLPVASFVKRMVEVPAVATALVLEIVSELLYTFNPSMVTLSAPLRSISGFAGDPEMVLAAPPPGEMVRDVHIPAAPVSALAPSSEVTSAVMEIVMVLPACVTLFRAANAPAAFVREAYVPSLVFEPETVICPFTFCESKSIVITNMTVNFKIFISRYGLRFFTAGSVKKDFRVEILLVFIS